MEKLHAVLSASGIISAKMTAGVPLKTSIKTSGYSKKTMVRMPGKPTFLAWETWINFISMKVKGLSIYGMQIH